MNPRTGTVYMADNPRFRVMCFQPEFRFETAPLRLVVGQPATGLTGTGGLAPMKFTVSASALPRGLTIDHETGIVSGTPQGKAGEDPGPYRSSDSHRHGQGVQSHSPPDHLILRCLRGTRLCGTLAANGVDRAAQTRTTSGDVAVAGTAFGSADPEGIETAVREVKAESYRRVR